MGYAPRRWAERWPVEAAKAWNSPPMRHLAGVAAGRTAFVAASRSLLEVADAAAGWESDEVATARIRQHLPDGVDLPVHFVEHHAAHAASAFWPAPFASATVVVAG